MQTEYRTLAVAAAAAFTLVSTSAETKLPVVEILGDRYYLYEAKKGDTLFGIAREYGWDDRELRRLNPNAISPLEKGFKIYYPCGSVNNETIAVEDLSTVSSQPVRHLVKRGETVYSIAMMYGIPIDRIYALNPASKEGIREGELLELQKTASAETGTNPEYHTVGEGETLYKLARQYNTTVASILKLNPGISENNFKAGAVIRIPESGHGVKTVETKVEQSRLVGFTPYTVEKEDTWTSIADKTGVSREELMEANKAVKKLKKNVIVGIPQIVTDSVMNTSVYQDPRELTEEGVGSIYEDVHGLKADSVTESVSIAIVLSDPTANKDLDYTRGFLTGIDRLKREQYKIRLKIIDGSQPSEDIITDLGEFGPDLVFTTSDKNIPGYLSDYATVSQIPVVNTFDVKDETFIRNPYFIQLLTPSNYFNEQIVENVKSTYRDADLILVGSPDTSDQLASTLKELWDNKKVYSIAGPEDFSSVTFSEDGNYVIYGYASKKGDVSNLLNAVKTVREDHPVSRIGMLGRPSWLVYDESLNAQLHGADVMIPSRFFFDKDSDEARRFMLEYKSLFNMQPIKSYPMYAALGYDSSMYFIPSMISSGGDLNNFDAGSSAVQSNFSLERLSNWSGMMNPVVYLVRFTPYDTIEKIEIK